MTCTANHLTTFSSTIDAVEWTALLSVGEGVREEASGLRPGRGLLVVLASVYLGVLMGMVAIRIKRANQSYAFLR
jgi:hypothetical protein